MHYGKRVFVAGVGWQQQVWQHVAARSLTVERGGPARTS
ncbi:hypothetical protein PAHAL_2G011800 [Panicum hallii]|uniref:Uncharacterized protein n=1 Tax=Panicum hallii TaxID=206008 RepID=A0A2T8KME1_9POAL|nr:hypothetical protein PAHAL_2G011800 [Panicum hallii]